MALKKLSNKDWQALLRQARNSPLPGEPELIDEVEAEVAEILAEGTAHLHPPNAVVFKDRAGRIWIWQPDQTGDGLKEKSQLKPGVRVRLQIYEIPRRLLVKFLPVS
jgi:hypothetical protein